MCIIYEAPSSQQPVCATADDTVRVGSDISPASCQLASGKILTTFSSTPSCMSRIVLDGDCSGLLGMLLVLILRISLPFTSANCHPVEHAKP